MTSGLIGAGTGVSICLTRDPALVRTVRLVAAAVARRTFFDEQLVEEVRLAVGEACALLVGPAATPSAADQPPIEVRMLVDDALRVVVRTTEPMRLDYFPAGEVDTVEPWALLRGLVDDFEIVEDDDVTDLVMCWPLA